MNSTTVVHATKPLLIAILLSGACVVNGTLDEADTAGTMGGAGTSAGSVGASTSTVGEGDPLESESSFGDGGFACADFTPLAEDCEPAGPAELSIVGSFPFSDVDRPCTISSVENAGAVDQEVSLDCDDLLGTVEPRFEIHSAEPRIPLPFAPGDPVLLTVRHDLDQYPSVAVRTMDGALLFAYVDAHNFEPDVDLGTIELVAGLSGCPSEPSTAALGCTAGGTVASQRTGLKVASAGPAGPTVFEGHSAVFEDNGRTFLLVVDHARELVCWDMDCPDDLERIVGDEGWVLSAEGSAAYMLVRSAG